MPDGTAVHHVHLKSIKQGFHSKLACKRLMFLIILKLITEEKLTQNLKWTVFCFNSVHMLFTLNKANFNIFLCGKKMHQLYIHFLV